VVKGQVLCGIGVDSFITVKRLEVNLLLPVEEGNLD
jgi:hypothetical protein